MAAIKWIKLPKTKATGVEYYVQSDGKKYYRLRATVRGTGYVDALGVRPEEEVLAIKGILDRNRKQGTGPQSYEEMIAVDVELKEQERKAKELARLNTIAALSKEYVAARELDTDKSLHDFKTVRSRHTKWIQAFFGDLQFAELEAGEPGKPGKTVYGFLLEMREKFLADKSVKEMIAELGRLWKYAIQKGVIPLLPYPGEGIGPKRVNNNRMAFLSWEQWIQLRDYFLEPIPGARKENRNKPRNQEAHDYCLIAIYTGMRVSEINRLTWHQVETRFIFKTKNGKARMIDGLGHPCVQEMLALRREENRTAGPHDLVFPRTQEDANGSMTSPRKEALDAFDTAVKTLGFYKEIPPPMDRNGNLLPEKPRERIEREQENRNNKIVFHSLRHTFGSWLVQTGKIDLPRVRDLMGHSSLQMTERYAHLLPGHIAGATNLLPGSAEVVASQEKKQIEVS